MKKFLLLPILLLTLINVSMSQAVDMRRRIEVSGIAQQEITPDIIHMSISLKEYMDGKNKVTISDLESQLEKSILDAGIPIADLRINNISSWNYTYLKKKNPDFLASKQYAITLHDLNKFNRILANVDPKGIQSTNIDSYDYSNIENLKSQLKLKALLTAKEKASMLLNGIGQKLGDPISIIESDNSSFPTQQRMLLAKSYSANDVVDSDIDFKLIKLSFEIRVVFEIIK